MTQHAPVAQHDDWVSIKTTSKGKQFPKERESFVRSIISFTEKTFTIVGLEARKIRHDPTDIFTRAVQPALWLLIFGEVLSRLRAIPTGGRPYLDFLAPGILAQSVLFIAIFSGIAIIWERDLGIVHKFLASPTPQSRSCSRQGICGRRARIDASSNCLLAGVDPGRQCELEPTKLTWCDCHRYPGSCLLLHILTHYCLPGKNA